MVIVKLFSSEHPSALAYTYIVLVVAITVPTAIGPTPLGWL